MQLDIATLAFVLGLVYISESIALFVQYKVDGTKRMSVMWLAGTIFMATGFVFMPLLKVKALALLAYIANPLIVMGMIFLYMGTAQFFGHKSPKRFFITFYTVFLVSYYYYILMDYSISGRTAVVSAAMAVLSIMIGIKLFRIKDRASTISANFIATIFLGEGFYYVVNTVAAIVLPPAQTYGNLRLIHLIAFIMPIATSMLWTFGFIILINQRLNEENRLEKEKLQLVFNTNPDAVLITRLSDGLFVDVNAGFLKLSGYELNEVLGVTTEQIHLWQDPRERERLIADLNTHQFCSNRESAFHRKNGEIYVGELSAKIITVKDVPHIISVVHDVTERKMQEEAIRLSEETYRSILDASPDDITITDLRGNILMVSLAANAMFGYSQGEELGRNILDFLVPEDQTRAKLNMVHTFEGTLTGPNEYRAIRKDGSTLEIEVNSRMILGVDDRPVKMVFIVRDISKRKQAEQQIQMLVHQLEIERNIAQLNAITDSLSGLANRRYFDDTLRTEFYRLKRTGAPLSMVMLDIDHFKKYNDTYGHLEGDDCLRRIGAVLKTMISRASDVVARYGGEEFMFILPETEEQGAAALAERIRESIQNLAIPHEASTTSPFVTVSLGVVTVHTGHVESPDQILHLVDEALYAAKQSGRNRVYISHEQNN